MPTDTLYGLSGNAWNEKAIKRIGRLKQRHGSATIIPHDIEWARCLIDKKRRKNFKTIFSTCPGATFLFRFEPDPESRIPERILTSSGLIAFRFPQHWITDMVRRSEIPLITTSVNRTTQAPMTDLADLNPDISAGTDFIIYEGRKENLPSPMCFYDQRVPRRVNR